MNLRPGRYRRGSGESGQGLVEFGLVAPVFFLITLGLIEASLLIFSVVSASFAAGEAARIASQEGTVSTADTDAVASIQATALGTTSLVNVTEIDVYKLNQVAGVLTPDSSGCSGAPCINKYKAWTGTFGSPSWLPISRNVQNGKSDFLGVTIKYTYPWKLGVLSFMSPPQLTATYYVRIEPKSY
jgi:Flp pilus assembly protein TadG